MNMGSARPHCGTCRYWEIVEGRSGLCHRYPPQILPEYDSKPSVYFGDWCGEWKMVEPVVEPKVRRKGVRSVRAYDREEMFDMAREHCRKYVDRRITERSIEGMTMVQMYTDFISQFPQGSVEGVHYPKIATWREMVPDHCDIMNKVYNNTW